MDGCAGGGVEGSGGKWDMGRHGSHATVSTCDEFFERQRQILKTCKFNNILGSSLFLSLTLQDLYCIGK